MFLLALQRLQRYSFVFLGSKFSTSCFDAFCRALFAVSVFYAIQLYFQLFRNFCRRVFLILFFSSKSRGPFLRNNASDTRFSLGCLLLFHSATFLPTPPPSAQAPQAKRLTQPPPFSTFVPDYSCCVF